MTAVSDETGRVTQFFAENVDSWGALEWFNRLAKAVREQDKAVLANDEVAIEICRNVVSSSAMRLVRDYEQSVRSALSAAPVGNPINSRHFEILAEAMAEVKAVADGQSDQSLPDIVSGCLAEINALPNTPPAPAASVGAERIRLACIEHASLNMTPEAAHKQADRITAAILNLLSRAEGESDQIKPQKDGSR